MLLSPLNPIPFPGVSIDFERQRDKTEVDMRAGGDGGKEKVKIGIVSNLLKILVHVGSLFQIAATAFFTCFTSWIWDYCNPGCSLLCYSLSQ